MASAPGADGDAGAPPTVRIHYLRPPHRLETYHQILVHETPAVRVTLLERFHASAPVRVQGRPVLAPGAAIVWFTFPGAWHDVGRFHDAAGRFTGYYANILTPVRFLGPLEWETTDLFLDVWLEPGGRVRLLDRDEFSAALERHWLDERTARHARAEAGRLLAAAGRGEWPPPVVHEWTLERARRHCRNERSG